MNPAIRMLLLLPVEVMLNIPPLNTFFWINNLGDKFITNDGDYIVFKTP